MSTTTLDPDKLLQWLDNPRLESPRDRAIFGETIMAYLEHLRGYKDDFDGKPAAKEMSQARAFLTLVNNDRHWRLARQYAPEFQGEDVDLTALKEPLRTIMTELRDRIHPPKTVRGPSQLTEEGLRRATYRNMLNYIEFVHGEKESTDAEEIEASQHDLRRLMKAIDTLSTAVETESGPELVAGRLFSRERSRATRAKRHMEKKSGQAAAPSVDESGELLAGETDVQQCDPVDLLEDGDIVQATNTKTTDVATREKENAPKGKQLAGKGRLVAGGGNTDSDDAQPGADVDGDPEDADEALEGGGKPKGKDKAKRKGKGKAKDTTNSKNKAKNTGKGKARAK